ncbi:hypothetical protein HanRHA438_Chr08g0358191 [Helianthus annuus]|uniref:Uncharacterized protein n=1 Tax=Helianthus annuus TaxID=4232 RepID=A0A251U7G5_HELAN|nr:hypothetical protein HanXRQr2_Chr08g0345921 [Helianthus annuus]KAJ0547548.1 hypothetical protein HanIR_Chr08g0373411 [Helianthus annuus]KAJ0898558.1 hypothetical protein HanRHA438_Chr08g0358191 [Helianthus annuus]KAJ0902217.1 hypothetical protein HanPSC8_Chr08g0334361 [Helianthus annuus]
MLTFQPTMLFICNSDERKKKSVRKAEMVVWRSCIEDQRGKCRFGEFYLQFYPIRRAREEHSLDFYRYGFLLCFLDSYKRVFLCCLC